jgi:hypothetical protein
MIVGVESLAAQRLGLAQGDAPDIAGHLVRNWGINAGHG